MEEHNKILKRGWDINYKVYNTIEWCKHNNNNRKTKYTAGRKMKKQASFQKKILHREKMQVEIGVIRYDGFGYL